MMTETQWCDTITKKKDIQENTCGESQKDGEEGNETEVLSSCDEISSWLDDLVSGQDSLPDLSGLFFELAERCGPIDDDLVADAGDLSFLPDALFDAGVFGRRTAAVSWFDRVFEPVLLPGDPTLGRIQSGDFIIRKSIEGPLYSTLSIAVDGEIISSDILEQKGYKSHNRQAGGYLHVVEPGPFDKTSIDRFARRVTDSSWELDPDIVVLRLRYHADTPNEEPAPSSETEITSKNGTHPPADLRTADRLKQGDSNSDIGRAGFAGLALDLPPLPDDIIFEQQRPETGELLRTLLKQGCYYARYRPASSSDRFGVFYEGTLRVQHDGAKAIASGDLYSNYVMPMPFSSQPFLFRAAPDTSKGIPVFPRSGYSYYLRITRITEKATPPDSIEITYEPWQYNPKTHTWTRRGIKTAGLEKKTLPTRYPSGGVFFAGGVEDARGVEVGRLSLGWVADKFRKAVVEIDNVIGSEIPRNNGFGTGWQTVFSRSGWDIDLKASDSNVREPSGNSWSQAELHAAMLAKRDRSDLDKEWRYHLLCIKELDVGALGIMYDAYGGDSNKIPREGAGIASHYMFPETVGCGSSRKRPGALAGRRFGSNAAAYFRTAVHEISHAIGLYHPSSRSGNHIMQQTGKVICNATNANPFPDNIDWHHSGADEKRLRHLPDHWVRPGGVPFGKDYSKVLISPGDLLENIPAYEFNVHPLHEIVPIGAPVRFELHFRNRSKMSMPGPRNVSLKSGAVSGEVSGPSGAVKPFSSLVQCMDGYDNEMVLEPGWMIKGAETLIRGRNGALFDTPGAYTVHFNLDWMWEDVPFRMTGETRVLITPPKDEAHALAAHRILSTPETQLVVAFGGDHLTEGVNAVRQALDHPVLRPHFAFTEFKRLSNAFLDRKPDFSKAFDLMNDSAILNSAEKFKAAKILNRSKDALQPEVYRRTLDIVGEVPYEPSLKDSGPSI